MLRQTSLGTLGLVLGGILTIVGFTAYFNGNPTLNLVGFFYGIPLLLGGLALKAAELVPIPFSQPTTPELLTLRKTQATATQNQIRQDVTRYRYGQEAHLDTTLSFLGLSPIDEERPVITGLREAEIQDAYALILEFDSPLIPLQVWQDKQRKMESFFGPGIRVEIAQPESEKIELALITTSQASSPTLKEGSEVNAS
ncbi:DUF2854 domain-containing protein [Gloeocapsopsis dulcis]|uniref:DUF2854 domain-containing protein n=1 Tax=Gloeocapsopsis dulcis AAB1 = 1H9 TaxID=1433147 RepID=A0A6N8FTD3_9CHRO|nr:DUF2854 domain-containing protein [Gloeocapsopsis dulcis]MUL36363.1 hypothetical protein [Gloeocapsopsis dulcis AAB1 = 1H9]WNN88141.1 DUF2854 domain-containing protein [Gloeocapsopsis dulcis]